MRDDDLALRTWKVVRAGRPGMSMGGIGIAPWWPRLPQAFTLTACSVAPLFHLGMQGAGQRLGRARRPGACQGRAHIH